MPNSQKLPNHLTRKGYVILKTAHHKAKFLAGYYNVNIGQVLADAIDYYYNATMKDHKGLLNEVLKNGKN